MPVPEDLLSHAQERAGLGDFTACLESCQHILDNPEAPSDVLAGAAALLQAYGFLTAARLFLDELRRRAPDDPRPTISLAGMASESGDPVKARTLYAMALAQHPHDLGLRSRVLLSLEYDANLPDAVRLAQARAWGEQAIAQAGGPRPRPKRTPHSGPLRIGYLSPDFCQHTVGLFIAPLIRAHDPRRVSLFAYSNGAVEDGVTAAVREAARFRAVRSLDDAALAELIRGDELDLLVDLAGHTADSRLAVLARRPAPVQASWLGYAGSTGLETVDAMLLDAWHAPAGAEAAYAEPILRLPRGRWCYVPVDWAPTVAPPPALARGSITFGSFNNTAKLNTEVLALWARILAAVPDSRLVLKWRTFHDNVLREAIIGPLVKHGIARERIELRGASYHADVLTEYADVDIALDPFPFTGGLTSCEALWMGVPVVTWPQSRAISRQSFAILSAIGLADLASGSAEEYVQTAVALAQDVGRLQMLRRTMRDRMRASPLCDLDGFARGLEDAFADLVEQVGRA